jgi:hypothetical protein
MAICFLSLVLLLILELAAPSEFRDRAGAGHCGRHTGIYIHARWNTATASYRELVTLPSRRSLGDVAKPPKPPEYLCGLLEHAMLPGQSSRPEVQGEFSASRSFLIQSSALRLRGAGWHASAESSATEGPESLGASVKVLMEPTWVRVLMEPTWKRE